MKYKKRGMSKQSIDAYRGLSHEVTGDMHRRCFEFVTRMGDHGATREEIQKATGMRLCSVTGRVSELLQMDVIQEKYVGGQKVLRTADSGCRVAVLVRTPEVPRQTVLF